MSGSLDLFFSRYSRGGREPRTFRSEMHNAARVFPPPLRLCDRLVWMDLIRNLGRRAYAKDSNFRLFPIRQTPRSTLRGPSCCIGCYGSAQRASSSLNPSSLPFLCHAALGQARSAELASSTARQTKLRNLGRQKSYDRAVRQQSHSAPCRSPLATLFSLPAIWQ